MTQPPVHAGKARRDTRTAWIFIAPFLAGTVILKLYPVLYGFVISFMNMNSLGKLKSASFCGLDNYTRILGDPIALSAFAKSFGFSAAFTLLTIVFAVVLAIMLNRKFIGRTAVRTMIYMPYVTNIIAVGIVWKFILNPYSGIINRFLLHMGMAEEALPLWLSGTSSALMTTAFINTWVNLAFPIIIILASLQDVPKELFESAEIDGASVWRRTRSIVFPMISPTLFFVLLVTLITSFRNYAVMIALTNGGPGDATRVISLNIYEEAFTYYKFSYASAQSVVLFIIVLAISLIQWRFQEKWVHY